MTMLPLHLPGRPLSPTRLRREWSIVDGAGSRGAPRHERQALDIRISVMHLPGSRPPSPRLPSRPTGAPAAEAAAAPARAAAASLLVPPLAFSLHRPPPLLRREAFGREAYAETGGIVVGPATAAVAVVPPRPMHGKRRGGKYTQCMRTTKMRKMRKTPTTKENGLSPPRWARRRTNETDHTRAPKNTKNNGIAPLTRLLPPRDAILEVTFEPRPLSSSMRQNSSGGMLVGDPVRRGRRSTTWWRQQDRRTPVQIPYLFHTSSSLSWREKTRRD